MQSPEHPPRKRSNLDALLLAVAGATLPLEAPPAAAQNIETGATWETGSTELARVARDERLESMALYVADGREGAFVDLRSAHDYERETGRVQVGVDAIAAGIDAAYQEATARGETPRRMRVLISHTHHSSSLRSDPEILGEGFRELVEGGGPLTLSPSQPDVQYAQQGGPQEGNILDMVRTTPREIVSLEYAVVDEHLTYFYRARPVEDHPLHSDLLELQSLIERTQNVVASLEEMETAHVWFVTSSDALEVSLLANSPQLTDLQRLLEEKGEGDLARDLFRQAERIRAASPQATFNEMRLAWSLYVSEARLRGDSWRSILGSEAYRALRDYYAFKNIDLRVVPNEEAQEQDPFDMPPGPVASISFSQ